MKKYLAEFIGTFILTFVACGAASFSAGVQGSLGVVGISLIFGLTVIAMAYSIGHISGCHINPAVSFGMLIVGKMSVVDFMGYVMAQVLGGIAAGAAMFGLTKSFSSEIMTQYKLYYSIDIAGLGTNGFDAQGGVLQINVWGAVIVELILTFIFVFTVINVTSKIEYSKIAGLIIGLTLTCVHLFGVPLTGTSVNPARSFGPALIKAILDGDSTALSQVWVFILAPLVGAALAALVYMIFAAPEKKLSEVKADEEDKDDEANGAESDEENEE